MTPDNDNVIVMDNATNRPVFKEIPGVNLALVAERLKTLEEWLIDPSTGQALATVIAALRGPDSSNEDLKSETTVVIRRAAFPRLAHLYDSGVSGWTTGALGAWDLYLSQAGRNSSVEKLAQLVRTNNHFNDHIVGAAKVLQLLKNGGHIR